MTTGRERLVVLLGYPLGHSLSPSIHNAAFRAQGLPFKYRSHPVKPEQLGQALDDLKAAGFAGANVTVPHKQAVIQHLNTASRVVRAVGAANTLVWNANEAGGTLHGDNTDVGGFLATLEEGPIEGAPIERAPIENIPCVILGSGGAARAVAYALATSTRAPLLTIAGRNPRRVSAVVEELAAYDPDNRLQAVDLDAAGPSIRDAGLIVNATPVGMYPDVDDSPWPHPEDFHEGQLVYDLIYNPSETRLMREARLAGAATRGGMEMLIQQAALSYRQWTGVDMDLEAAKASLNP